MTRLEIKPGTSLRLAMREAALMASKLGDTVEFEFENLLHVAHPGSPDCTVFIKTEPNIEKPSQKQPNERIWRTVRALLADIYLERRHSENDVLEMAHLIGRVESIYLRGAVDEESERTR